MPDPNNDPVEEYLNKIEKCISKHNLIVNLNEEFLDIKKEQNEFNVATRKNRYRARHIVLAFGSNIPVELGIYGEAKTVARKLDNPAEHIGARTLSWAAAMPPRTLPPRCRKPRAADDHTPVYWGHKKEHFKIDKEVARDLGEEILLGGNIKILPAVVPKIGEVDKDGVERLLVQTQNVQLGQGVELQQGMSFPMKHVIACIGTQGPSPVFDRLSIQQITCTEGICKIGKEGARIDSVATAISDQHPRPLRHRRGHQPGLY